MENELLKLEDAQFEDVNQSIMPPSDIVAYNELRSCSDIFRMYSKKQLEIKPDFQRNEVWLNQDKTRFVDSVMKGLPIPSMCISLDIKTQKRLVIDGLQRISTIIHFLNDPKDEDWKMAKCEDVYEEISGKKVSDVLNNNPDLYERFENATIPITVIRCDYSNSIHMEYLFNIFKRLNSGGIKLNNQEIRNCIYQGTFNTFLKNIAKSESWKNLRNNADNKRHKEDELVLRFYAMYDMYETYTGNMTSFLNNYMSQNKTLTEEKEKQFNEIMENTLLIAANIEDLQSQGVNVLVSVLVGIAKNIESLRNKNKEEITNLYQTLMSKQEFSEQSLQDALGAKNKVIERLNKSIQIFGCNE